MTDPDARPTPSPPYGSRAGTSEAAGRLLAGPVGRLVQARRGALLALAATHGVTVLGVFGSVARGEDDEDSDVDLLVALPAGMGLFGFGQLADEVRDLLGVGVDVVPVDALRAAIRDDVVRDLVPL